MVDLREEVARALVPVMYGGNEDENGRDLPPMQFDGLPPDWQEAFKKYADTIIPIVLKRAAEIARAHVSACQDWGGDVQSETAEMIAKAIERAGE